MKTFINIGLGVNSTAILALIKMGKLKFENAYAIFADVGAEKQETYEYLKYLKKVSPIKIITVRAKEKEGNLYEYCKKKKILPQRFMRWCTHRWKRNPLEKFRKSKLRNNEDFKIVIGIAYDEKHRAIRWMNDPNASFPLIDLEMSRQDCINIIKQVGWKVPVKSGCWFCPFAPITEFANLKKNNRGLYNELCEMEKICLENWSKEIKGWFNDKYPLDELLKRKASWSSDGQICLNCFDGEYK